jgi:uncharacterized protein (DUF488 family)
VDKQGHIEFAGNMTLPDADSQHDVTVFTIGHSTHPIEKFITMLTNHGVTTLIDVRTIPKSAHNPQFTEDALADSLRTAGLTYKRAKDLGGLRSVRKNSPNGGWRNTSFQGYADYMQTPEFGLALDDLIAQSRHSDVAIMCAEAVPWRCHRSLIGDALSVRGIAVLDIMTETKATPHVLRSFARVDGTTVTYPPDGDEGPASIG